MKPFLYAALLAASFTFASPSFATCVMSCTETDSEMEPTRGGIAAVRFQCAAGGVPSMNSISTYRDICQGKHQLIEYQCSGGGDPTNESVIAQLVPCASRCTDSVRGASCVPGIPPNCRRIRCPVAPPNCRYVAPTTTNGCVVGCGTLHCSSDLPSPEISE